MATTLLTCCTRQDDTKYRHWCACPSATLITKSVEKMAVMCGQTDPDGTADPKTFYKTKVVTGEVDRYIDGPKVDTRTYERDEEGDCSSSDETEGSENCSGFEDGGSYYTKYFEDFTNPYWGDHDNEFDDEFVVAISAGGCYFTHENSWDGTTCDSTRTATGGVDWSIDYTSACSYSDGANHYEQYTVTGSGQFPLQTSGGPNFGDGGDYTFTLSTGVDCNTLIPELPIDYDAVGGATDITERYEVADQITGQSGTEGTEYSDADTEADALDAATATEGTSTISIYQTRGGSNPNFTKRTVDYCVLCTNLVKGKSYNGKIPKRSQTAVVGTIGTWVDEESDTFTITAAVGASRTHNKFHIEGGTLNESITPQEFIDESYSLDPTDYGLDASEDVITPDTELDNIQGYEYQIGQNDSGDPFYVEADA